jgi:hypothetical protein
LAPILVWIFKDMWPDHWFTEVSRRLGDTIRPTNADEVASSLYRSGGRSRSSWNPFVCFPSYCYYARPPSQLLSTLTTSLH